MVGWWRTVIRRMGVSHLATSNHFMVGRENSFGGRQFEGTHMLKDKTSAGVCLKGNVEVQEVLSRKWLLVGDRTHVTYPSCPRVTHVTCGTRSLFNNCFGALYPHFWAYILMWCIPSICFAWFFSNFWWVATPILQRFLQVARLGLFDSTRSRPTPILHRWIQLLHYILELFNFW
jgi:hypothetical protein